MGLFSSEKPPPFDLEESRRRTREHGINNAFCPNCGYGPVARLNLDTCEPELDPDAICSCNEWHLVDQAKLKLKLLWQIERKDMLACKMIKAIDKLSMVLDKK